MSHNEAEESTDILDDIIVNKYKMAAEVTNSVLFELISLCKSGVLVSTLCEFGDKKIIEKLGCLFKKDKKIKKGVCFPTSISINNIICHYAPLEDKGSVALQDGDVIKINLGSHIDGYAAVVGHTIVLGSSKDEKVTGKKADVILAANYAAEGVLRLLRPGNQSTEVVDLVSKIAAEFSCHPVDGTKSHQMKQLIYETEKNVVLKNLDVMGKSSDKCTFEENDVWDIDIIISSGGGKARTCDFRTTVYKKFKNYSVKLKASRALFSEVENTFFDYPFNIRSSENLTGAKLALHELVKNEVLQPFEVFTEKDGEFVAQFRYTVLMMPNGPMKITGAPVDLSIYKSTFKIDSVELKEIISLPIKIRSKKKKPTDESNNLE